MLVQEPSHLRKFVFRAEFSSGSN